MCVNFYGNPSSGQTVTLESSDKLYSRPTLSYSYKRTGSATISVTPSGKNGMNVIDRDCKLNKLAPYVTDGRLLLTANFKLT